MISTWLPAIPSMGAALLVLLVPGCVVLFSGWRPSVRLVLVAPAVSIALTAVTGVLASAVGVTYGLLPLTVLTLVTAAVAYGLRRWVGEQPEEARLSAVGLAAIIGAVVAAAIMTWQSFRAFGAPENISQTFDNVAHLNTVAFGLHTGDVSPFHIGQASGGPPFYPNGWHSIVVLVVQVTGATVPVAINATNVVLVSVAWPMSAMALAWAAFRGRPAAVFAASVVATAYAAFPMVLLAWGVLYPNVAGLSVLGAVISLVIEILRSDRPQAFVRDLILLLACAAGIGLAHPNAFMGLLALSLAWIIARAATLWIASDGARARLAIGAGLLVIGVAYIVVWRLAHIREDQAHWSPWQYPAQAFGEGTLIAPDHQPLTLGMVLLLMIGFLTAVRHRRYWGAVLQYGIGVALFVVCSGFAEEHILRRILTNPWYNDPYRVAALLPIAALPIVVLGVVVVWDLLRRLVTTTPAAVRAVTAGVAAAALVVVSQGASAQAGVADVQRRYAYTDDARLLSPDELALLQRLDDKVPDDALIIGSPRTGASLAYAIAGREVTEKHIFGQLSEDERFLDQNLRNIDEDPAVCDAVRRTGVDYVLDFGDRDIQGRNDIKLYDGVQNLDAGPSLKLIDQEGDDARLFRIVGCD